jgi:hypothetical protein
MVENSVLKFQLDNTIDTYHTPKISGFSRHFRVLPLNSIGGVAESKEAPVGKGQGSEDVPDGLQRQQRQHGSSYYETWGCRDFAELA